MGLRDGLLKRVEVMRDLARMARARRTFILLPLILALCVVLLFMLVAEMPVLIPFFYAVF